MTRTRLAHLVLAAALAPLAACVDQNADAAMVILQNLAPETGCATTADSNVFRSGGVIEPFGNRGYFFTPVVRNDLLLREGEPETPKTIFVEGARIEIEFFEAGLFSATEITAFEQQGLLKFRSPSSGSISPGGGRSTFGFDIVPGDLVDAIGVKLEASGNSRTVLDVTVQMYGTRGGSSIDSNVFHYPVEVCIGCLVQDLGACSGLMESFTPAPGGACGLAQDGLLQCCDNYAVCPARGTMGT